jgi:hypothetical protein
MKAGWQAGQAHDIQLPDACHLANACRDRAVQRVVVHGSARGQRPARPQTDAGEGERDVRAVGAGRGAEVGERRREVRTSC